MPLARNKTGVGTVINQRQIGDSHLDGNFGAGDNLPRSRGDERK